MKKFLLFAFVAIAACITSCKKNEQPEAPKPEYREDAYTVCRGYLNMLGTDVEGKLMDDWNNPSVLVSYEGDDVVATCTAKYETIVVFSDQTKKVYKVHYEIKLPESDRAKMISFAKNFCQNVSDFYTTVKKTNYNSGNIFTDNGGYDFSNHNDFVTIFNEKSSECQELVEKWGEYTGFCQKTWSARFDKDNKSTVYAEFILDLG